MLEVFPERFVFSVNAGARLILANVIQEENESAVDQWLDWESACLLVGIWFPAFFHVKSDCSLHLLYIYA